MLFFVAARRVVSSRIIARSKWAPWLGCSNKPASLRRNFLPLFASEIMIPTTILKLDPPVEPQDYFLAPEKLISGNPKQTVWMHYTDATNQFFVGVWRSEPGKWRIAYTEEEYCLMLEGTSIITNESGEAITLVAGDSFVIPRGFVGTWEVVVATTKRFVIYEKGSR